MAAECARAVLNALDVHDAGLLPTSLDGEDQGRGGACERARSDWLQRNNGHRAVVRSYHTRWLSQKQALQRPDPTVTAKERLCGRCASRKSAAPCPLLLSLVSQRISVIPTVRWQSLCCTVLKMHRYIAETLSMSTSERPYPNCCEANDE